MTFISCQARRSQPKVHIRVCRTCRRQMTCWSYQTYVQPSLFPLTPGHSAGRFRLPTLPFNPAAAPGAPEESTALNPPRQLSFLGVASDTQVPGSCP